MRIEDVTLIEMIELQKRLAHKRILTFKFGGGKVWIENPDLEIDKALIEIRNGK